MQNIKMQNPKRTRTLFTYDTEELSKELGKEASKQYDKFYKYHLEVCTTDSRRELTELELIQFQEGIQYWPLICRHNIKRLGYLVSILRDTYIRGKEKGIGNLDWITEFYDLYIDKCTKYFIRQTKQALERLAIFTEEYEATKSELTKEEKKQWQARLYTARKQTKYYNSNIEAFRWWKREKQTWVRQG